MSIIEKNLVVTMSNGETWEIPVTVIAESRASYYSKEFDGDVQESLIKDTLPLFSSDNYEIEDWAKNNMDWDDIEDEAKLISSTFDYQEAWLDSEVSVI